MIKLICLDMDGVLTSESNFWLQLHEAWGTAEEGKELTKKYLRTDFQRLMDEVLGRLWIGKDERAFLDLVQRIPLSPGIGEFFAALDALDIPRAIISSGPRQLAERIQGQYGIAHVYANDLIFREGVYLGEYRFEMRSGDAYKTAVLHELCAQHRITPADVLYIGDDVSDLHVFQEVGMSIAFHAKDPDLKRAATHVVESGDLRKVIPLLEESHS